MALMFMKHWNWTTTDCLMGHISIMAKIPRTLNPFSDLAFTSDSYLGSKLDLFTSVAKLNLLKCILIINLVK